MAISLANQFGVATGGNGVSSSGGTYTKTTKQSHQAEDLRMISGTAVQRDGMA